MLRARLADIWHVLALLYVAAIFGVWAAQITGGFEFIARASVISIVVLIAVKALASAVRHASSMAPLSSVKEMA